MDFFREGMIFARDFLKRFYVDKNELFWVTFFCLLLLLLLFFWGEGRGGLTTWLHLHPPGTNVFIPIFFCGSVFICNILVQILKAVAVSIKILVNYGSISNIYSVNLI